MPGTTAETAQTRRAVYLSLDQGYNVQHPPVLPRAFLQERDRALAEGTPTGTIVCDNGEVIDAGIPATLPLMLARYLRVNAGETLAARFRASSELFYVIRGHGRTEAGDEAIDWGPGDIFLLPGGLDERHVAGDEECVLWQCTNEPQLAFERLEPPPPGEAAFDATHYPAAEVAGALDRMRGLTLASGVNSTAVQFCTERMTGRATITPSWTLGLNSVAPDTPQPPHVHNAAAMMLVLEGDRAYSMIAGERYDWSPFATVITPALATHTHHNDGNDLARILIVQDAGLYYHMRTPGFAWL